MTSHRRAPGRVVGEERGEERVVLVRDVDAPARLCGVPPEVLVVGRRGAAAGRGRSSWPRACRRPGAGCALLTSTPFTV